MARFYAFLGFSFIILFIVNLLWIILNLYLWITTGLQSMFQEMNFVERIHFSILLKWIILADVIWMGCLVTFVLKRKQYKTDKKYYLENNPIEDPKISVVIPTFNEEENVKKIVTDYISQKYVEHVFVIDNNSSDKTVEIAKQCGAKVITKEINKGFGDSCILGFTESLKTDANIIALTECDGTYNAYDLKKMVPYLDNCDTVVGTRIIQVLTEKGNQNGIFNTWGNFFIGKVIQAKYFSLAHMGIASYTDMGCAHRCFRRESLEHLLPTIKIDYYDKKIDGDGWMFLPYLHQVTIDNGLKTVEIPITFNKRNGESKSGAQRKLRGLEIGLKSILFTLKS